MRYKTFHDNLIPNGKNSYFRTIKNVYNTKEISMKKTMLTENMQYIHSQCSHEVKYDDIHRYMKLS